MTQLQHNSHSIRENTFRSSMRRELVELQKHSEHTPSLEAGIQLVPESAYNDALYLLEILYNYGIPIPDINSTNHGSISLKWYTEDGTATMYLCGNGLVVYDTYSDEDSKDDGACLLSDTDGLDELLGSLRCLYFGYN